MKIIAKSAKEAHEQAKEILSAKAEELEKTHTQGVFYYALLDGVEIKEEDEPNEYDFAEAFMKKPNRQAMMGAMDLIYGMQHTKAADNLWFANGLTDVTDPRVIKDDDLYLGLITAIIDEVKFVGVTVKKN